MWHESYLGFFGTRRTKECRHILLPYLLDEPPQGHFGVAVRVCVHNIQSVVPQQGGIAVYLVHGDLNGRAQAQGTEGQGHVPGSLKSDGQLVALGPDAAVVGDSQHQHQVTHKYVPGGRGAHRPQHHSQPTCYLMLLDHLNTRRAW